MSRRLHRYRLALGDRQAGRSREEEAGEDYGHWCGVVMLMGIKVG